MKIRQHHMTQSGFKDGIIDELGNLDMHYLRFPGGTVSQYYHFYGSNGYGGSPYELSCRDSFINLPSMETKMQPYVNYPENLINQYVELIKGLESQQDRNIGTYYSVNILTHFLNRDLVPLSNVLDELINEEESLVQYLDMNPEDLSFDETKIIADCTI